MRQPSVVTSVYSSLSAQPGFTYIRWAVLNPRSAEFFQTTRRSELWPTRLQESQELRKCLNPRAPQVRSHLSSDTCFSGYQDTPRLLTRWSTSRSFGLAKCVYSSKIELTAQPCVCARQSTGCHAERVTQKVGGREAAGGVQEWRG